MPKVAVIGLLKPQRDFDVKELFAKWLDIRTVHADARGKSGHTSKSAMIIMDDGPRISKEEFAQKVQVPLSNGYKVGYISLRPVH